MLIIFRRHLKKCEHRSEGRKYRRCHCPIWVDGFIGGREIRQSLKLRDWNKAQDQVRDWEAEGQLAQRAASEPATIEHACAEFERDAEARGLREPTLYKYRLLFRRLKEFARECGLRYLSELDLSRLREFRASWPNKNLAAVKKLEALKTFFRFAHDSSWIDDNPARKLKNPKVEHGPTLPFERDEVVRILAACEAYPQECGGGNAEYSRKLRALVLLLRYSGLRIRDAVMLSRDRIREGKLLLYTAKTGTPVYCPLPDVVVNALDAVLRPGSPYYFWSGEAKPKSAVGDWQRSLAKLFKLAKVPGAHAHRLRDTLAVESLLAGIPIEQVSALLGHQSLRVTERYYAPWVRARQEQLEASVRRAWVLDPVVSLATKGTHGVHGKTERVN
jgi:integrase/recombinase XerD